MGVIVTHESEFSDDDVALLLAHQELEARPRNALGILLEEATDPENQFAYEGRDAPVTDWATASVGRKQDAYYKANEGAPRHGHLWLLKPRDEEENR